MSKIQKSLGQAALPLAKQRQYAIQQRPSGSVHYGSFAPISWRFLLSFNQ